MPAATAGTLPKVHGSAEAFHSTTCGMGNASQTLERRPRRRRQRRRPRRERSLVVLLLLSPLSLLLLAGWFGSALGARNQASALSALSAASKTTTRPSSSFLPSPLITTGGARSSKHAASSLSASASSAASADSASASSSSSSSPLASFSSSMTASAFSQRRQKGISSLTLYSPFYVSDNESGNNRTWSALTSWMRLVPQKNIILFTEDDASCSWLRQNGFKGILCLLECTHPVLPRQDIGCMAATAARVASTPHLCLINSDIMLLPHFRRYFRRVFVKSDITEPFMVGQRTNVLQNDRTDFSSPAWEFQVLREAFYRGEVDGACAMDYFVHTKNVWKHISMPGFVTGVWLWDRYLLSEANRNEQITTVDATRAFTAVHLQTEGYIAHEARPYQEFNAEVLKRHQTMALNDEGSTNKADLFLERNGTLHRNLCSSTARVRAQERSESQVCVPTRTICGIEYLVADFD